MAATIIPSASISFVGSWSSFGSPGGYNGETWNYHGAGSGTNKASWAFTGLTAGVAYYLALTWVTANANRATNTPWTIYDSDGTTPLGTGTVNQLNHPPVGQVQGGVTFQWLKAVTPSGTSLTVTITDNADGTVIADAALLQPASDPAIVCGAIADGNWSAAATWAGGIVAAVPRAVTGAANSGSGLIRLAVASTTGWLTGNKLNIVGISGTTEANGVWTVTVIDGTHIDLQSSVFANAYTSGGSAFRDDSVASSCALALDSGACDAGGQIIVGGNPSTGGTAALNLVSTPGAASTLTVASGLTLRVRGPIVEIGQDAGSFLPARLTLGAGARLVIDPPSGQQYTWTLTHQAFAICNGASGSRCIVQTDLSRGGSPTYIVRDTGSYAWGGLVTAAYTDFANFGTGSIYGLLTYGTLTTSITNCTFTGCSYRLDGDPAMDGNLTFTGNRFLASTSLSDSGLGISGICATFASVPAPVSAVRSVSLNAFDLKLVNAGCHSLPVHDNVTGGYEESSSPTWPDDTYFYNNVIAITDGGTPGISGSIKDCYILKTQATANPHYITAGLNTVFTGVVFEAPNTASSDGDVIFPASGSGTFKAYKCFMLPNNGGGPTASTSGKLISAITSGVAITVEHCLSWGQGADAASLIQLGENIDSYAGEIASCKANLMFDPTAGFGTNYFVYDGAASAGHISATDAVTAADYNGSYHPTTGTITAAGVSRAAVGYQGIIVTAGGIAGAGGTNTQIGLHDFTGDPQFADTDYRVFAKWGAKRRGTAQTYAGAMAALQADPTLIPDLLSWVRAGYAPTNAAYANATYPGDAMTTDANGNALGGTVGPMAFVSASSFQPWILGDQIGEMYG